MAGARLYTPVEWGQFSLVWSVAANLAVVGCARYEFALALETDEPTAARLMALCLRVWLAVLGASVLVGGLDARPTAAASFAPLAVGPAA